VLDAAVLFQPRPFLHIHYAARIGFFRFIDNIPLKVVLTKASHPSSELPSSTILTGLVSENQVQW
jgi:hypothetical protein